MDTKVWLTCVLFDVRTDTNNLVTSSLIFGGPARLCCRYTLHRCVCMKFTIIKSYEIPILRFPNDVLSVVQSISNYSFFLCNYFFFELKIKIYYGCTLPCVIHNTHNLLFILQKFYDINLRAAFIHVEYIRDAYRSLQFTFVCLGFLFPFFSLSFLCVRKCIYDMYFGKTAQRRTQIAWKMLLIKMKARIHSRSYHKIFIHSTYTSYFVILYVDTCTHMHTCTRKKLIHESILFCAMHQKQHQHQQPRSIATPNYYLPISDRTVLSARLCSLSSLWFYSVDFELFYFRACKMNNLNGQIKQTS